MIVADKNTNRKCKRQAKQPETRELMKPNVDETPVPSSDMDETTNAANDRWLDFFSLLIHDIESPMASIKYLLKLLDEEKLIWSRTPVSGCAAASVLGDSAPTEVPAIGTSTSKSWKMRRRVTGRRTRTG